MRFFCFCALTILLVGSIAFSPAAYASRGIDLSVKTRDGKREIVPLYKGSYALLVGVSDYTHGWPDLTSIPSELDELGQALQAQGFTLTKVLNPDSRQLADAFADFIDKYGFDKENRLLFFYSGHGYSRTQVEKGYIVPADAPDPRSDEHGFARKAIEMEQLLTWARRIESKHALFLFDSCFSGTVFQSRALPSEPPHISAMAARPVRQFISAGSAGEEVPARSVFVPSFIRAIEGEGDLDRDGYITGTELGMYLNRQVTGYRVGQTPQYGKIRDPRLDQGDFVLVPELNRETDTRSASADPKTKNPRPETLMEPSAPDSEKYAFLAGAGLVIKKLVTVIGQNRCESTKAIRYGGESYCENLNSVFQGETIEFLLLIKNNSKEPISNVVISEPTSDLEYIYRSALYDRNRDGIFESQGREDCDENNDFFEIDTCGQGNPKTVNFYIGDGADESSTRGFGGKGGKLEAGKIFALKYRVKLR